MAERPAPFKHIASFRELCKTQERMRRESVSERELTGEDTDKHRGQNDISMITLRPIHNIKCCSVIQHSTIQDKLMP